MKAKILALSLIFVVAVMSVSVFAIAPVDVVDTANEAVADTSVADEGTLSAVTSKITSWKPGLNVYTGTSGVQTFDGFTDQSLQEYFTYKSDVAITAGNDSTYGTNVKAYKTNGGWTDFYILVDDSLALNRPAFYYQNLYLPTGSNTEGSGYVINLYNPDDTTISHFSIPLSANDTWISVSKNSSTHYWNKHFSTFNMNFGTEPYVYIDNMVLVPWYQITYKNIDEDGNSLGDDIICYFIADDPASVTVTDLEVTGIATSYTVDSAVRIENDNSRLLFSGWSTTQNDTIPDTVVNLNNSDIVLYPVWKEIEYDENVVIYEDFEDIADGTLVNVNEFNESTGNVVSKYTNRIPVSTRDIFASGVIGQGDQPSNITVTKLEDGNTVLDVEGFEGYSSQYRMLYIDVVPTTTALSGKYSISYDYSFDEEEVGTPKSVYPRVRFGTGSSAVFASLSGIEWNTKQKGNWYNYSLDYEIKDDGKLYYKSSSVSLGENVLSRFDLVNVYTESIQDTHYYIDNIVVTFKASRNVTVNYKDSNGNDIYTDSVLHYDIDGFELALTSELGLEYVAKYTVNGKTYYPGECVLLADDVDTVDVIVSNTNVLYRETFDTLDVESSGTTSNPSFSYCADGFSGIIGGGDYASVESFNTKLVDDRSVLEVKRTAAGTYTSLGFYSLNIGTKPGDYIFTVVFKPDSIGANDTVSMQDKGVRLTDGSYNTFNLKKLSTETDEDGFITVKFGANVYVDENGTAFIKATNGGTIREFNGHMKGIMFYLTGTNTEAPTFYVDEMSVEYIPYTPKAVNLVSFRAADPAGIRFASYVDNDQKSLMAEYGFLATRKTFLTSAAQAAGTDDYLQYLYVDNDTEIGTSSKIYTNADGINVIGALAYNGTVDRIYAEDGECFSGKKYLGLNDYVTFFTGVVVGLTTEEQKAETFVVVPYSKIDGVYYYGTAYEASYNDVYSE